MADSTGKKRVMVVDDEHIVAETLEIIFKNAGHEARRVDSAEAAIALLEVANWIPQFAIIDVQLPGMNGIDLATKLKAQYPQVRVSLFSGRAETAEILEEATRQGRSFDVMAKPVHPTIFLGILAANPFDEADHQGTTTPVP